MLYVMSYETKLALWWDARRDSKEGYVYRVWIDGACVLTDKVLYDFNNLQAGRTYNLTVELLDEKGNKVGKTETMQASTLPYRKCIDMSKPPYSLVGDGKTDYTQIINKAIDDCKADEFLYFPLGRYVCGKLNFSGSIKIKMDAGAVFCSNDKEISL